MFTKDKQQGKKQAADDSLVFKMAAREFWGPPFSISWTFWGVEGLDISQLSDQPFEWIFSCNHFEKFAMKSKIPQNVCLFLQLNDRQIKSNIKYISNYTLLQLLQSKHSNTLPALPFFTFNHRPKYQITPPLSAFFRLLKLVTVTLPKKFAWLVSLSHL